MTKRADGNFRRDSKIGKHFDKIVRLYQDGMSTQMLGEKFGIDSSNIYRGLKSHGVKLRDHKASSNLASLMGRLRRKRGAGSPKWKGGIGHHSAGYVLISAPDHPRADNRGYVFEHILVAEKIIGRLLSKSEHVHHINGIKNDNRPENLQVMSKHDHHALHGREVMIAKHARSKQKKLKHSK